MDLLQCRRKILGENSGLININSVLDGGSVLSCSSVGICPSLYIFLVLMEAGCCLVQVHALISDRRHDICVPIHFVLLRSPFAVAEQKDDPSDQENARGCPADEESFSQFAFLRIHHQRVVEVPDDGVANPADGDERGQKGSQKQNPT